MPIFDHHATLAIFGLPGGTEWIVLLLLGLLLFGRRLPEVGRSLGRSIVEFKRGIKGVEDEIQDATSEATRIDSTPRPEISSSSTTGQTEASKPYAKVEESQQ
jgi:sec-independent protein translocase protein TatA